MAPTLTTFGVASRFSYSGGWQVCYWATESWLHLGEGQPLPLVLFPGYRSQFFCIILSDDLEFYQFFSSYKCTVPVSPGLGKSSSSSSSMFLIPVISALFSSELSKVDF